MGKWIGVPKNIKDYAGFVYCITNKKTGKKYIGKKAFWAFRKLKPLKGKKRKRIQKKESDWRDYYGSSYLLHIDKETIGAKGFSRRILSCHKTRWEMSYHEARLQFERKVLFRPDEYYNRYIGTRLRAPSNKIIGDNK